MTIGTVRSNSNRNGMPKDLKSLSLRAGESAFRRKGKIAVVKWKDKREVSVINNCT